MVISQASVCAVALGPGDDLLTNLAAELEASLDGAAEVDAGPDAGGGVLLGPRLEERRVPREEVAQHLGRAASVVAWPDG